ncbi:MAG: dihydrodipicolinate synthase family protein [Chloroflexi bacterium]|nr:dihydrodipicolinate synthase family protein [Chloroflexota bacterium]
MTVRRKPSTFVISITPFDDQERLDEQALRLHYRRLAASGIGVYVVGGGSGEAYTLTREEQSRIMHIAAEELKGKVPARAMGVEPRTAREMIDFARMVEDSGLEAMQVYSLDMGHGRSPSYEEMDRYFSDVLNEVKLPSIISTHQSVGYFVPVDLMRSLVDRYPQVIGVNLTSADVTYLQRMLDALPERIDLHVGGPMHTMTALAMGANGYLATEGNLAPKLCQSVVELYAAGDYRAAEEAYCRLMRLFAMNMSFGGTKAALSVYGLPGGMTRRPRLPRWKPESEAIIRKTLEELDIPRTEGFARA